MTLATGIGGTCVHQWAGSYSVLCVCRGGLIWKTRINNPPTSRCHMHVIRCVMGRTMPRLSHPVLSHHLQLRRDHCSGDVHTSPAWPLALQSCPFRPAAVPSGTAASSSSSPVGTPRRSAMLNTRRPALLHCYRSAHSSTHICLLLVSPE